MKNKIRSSEPIKQQNPIQKKDNISKVRSDDSARYKPESMPPEIELLWRHYALHTDLYKQYLDLAVKFNVFYYAVTGGILSFYFSSEPKGVIRYALLFPMLMSIFFSVLSFYGSDRVKYMAEEVDTIRDKLGFNVSPDIRFLAFILRVCGMLFTVIYIGIILAFLFIQ